MKEEVMVSICCITYNHEKYIKSALESFLKQKTSFRYEIIVHDDASTDGTAKIIKEFSVKYPDIIFPILQKKNKYAQGYKISPQFVWPKARGKYIALCEGDDFWTDDMKLQKQINIMEGLNYSFCCHGNIIENISNGCVEKNIYKNFAGEFDLKKYLSCYYKITPKTLFHTSSLFIRKEYIIELIQEKPQFYFECPVGDIPLQLYLLTKGNGYYLNEIMSAYRINVENSWSFKMNKADNYIKQLKAMINLYKQYEIYCKGKYKKIQDKFIKSYEFLILLRQNKYRQALSLDYISHLLRLPIKSQLYIFYRGITNK